MLHPGQRVSRELVLLRRIGAGAMGEVWAARHEGIRRDVAVKFILAEALQQVPKAGKRFLREAVNAARIRSPYVVQTFEYAFTPEGTPYIAMELLDGESVHDRLERQGPLSIYETSLIIRHIGQALDSAHELGIIHRDIKPQNVFLSMDGRRGLQAKVLDFGNAKSLVAPVVTNVSSPGLLAGSPAYVSRDLLLDPDDLDHRVDLWALAVTAFKCLTGDLPFRGRLLMQTVQKIIDGELQSASALRPELGHQCDAWFERVFAEQADLRPRTGAEMADTFDAQMGIAHQRPAFGSIAPRRFNDNAFVRWALVAAATLAASGVAFAAYAY
jgi:serine/threonine-protein kinase